MLSCRAKAQNPAPASAPPLAAALPSWNGFYLGGNVGWGFGDANTSGNLMHSNLFSQGSVIFNEHLEQNGPSGGIEAGYNWQRGNAILGIETDIQVVGQHSTGTHQSNSSGAIFTTAQSITNHDSFDWFGTVRGRLGYAIWPSTMVYATGGFAYGGLSDKPSVSFNDTVSGVTAQFNAPAGSASVVKAGFTAGAGLEGWVPNSPLTWKIEYLYVNLGTAFYNFTATGTANILMGGIIVSTTPASAPATIGNKFTDNILRVGLNYHF